jgi:hypothetical protein
LKKTAKFTLRTKVLIYQACVLLYGAETWTIYARQGKKTAWLSHGKSSENYEHPMEQENNQHRNPLKSQNNITTGNSNQKETLMAGTYKEKDQQPAFFGELSEGKRADQNGDSETYVKRQ